MNIMQSGVRDFHVAFGHPAPLTPNFDHINLPTDDGKTRVELREKLIREELEETMKAIRAKDMVETADGIGDILYVTLGMAVELGIDMDRVFAKIQESNMAKLGPDGKPITREDGKTLKPDGWQPPTEAIEHELLSMGWSRPYNE